MTVIIKPLADKNTVPTVCLIAAVDIALSVSHCVVCVLVGCDSPLSVQISACGW